jgi:prevent-host-death family protein
VGIKVTENVNVGIAQAKRDLSVLIRRVTRGGQRILLTAHGKPQAALVSIEDLERLQRTASFDWQAALTQADTVREMIRARRGGVPLPDSAAGINELREERADELASLR